MLPSRGPKAARAVADWFAEAAASDWPPGRRYAFAVAAFAAAWCATRAFAPALGNSAPFLCYFPAILLASIYGGFAPGLICTALSALVAANAASGHGEGLRMLLFLGIATFICALNAALKITTKSLRESLARTREILESISDGFYMLDHRGRLEYVNRAAERLWGRRREELLGRELEEVFPQVRGSDTYEAVVRARIERAPRHVEGLSPVLGRWVEAEVRPVAGGVAVYFRDITERKRRQADLERRVERRTARLKEVNDELETFTYSASHDLRAPARKILGFCDLIARLPPGELGDEPRRYFDRIRAAAEQMRRLLDEMLNMAQATQHEMRPETVDVSALASRLLEEKRAADPGRTVKTVVAPGVRVHADPQLVWVVLHNLIDNAWKFTALRADARIEFGVAASPSGRAYFIKDDGVGFDMAHSHKLFKAFERLHESDEFPGTGVGLAIAQRVVRRHGGEIWGESRPGEGAAFYFTLPESA